jgi:vacuolar-type H+-ATPase catalytic subunit A/Vma1
MIADSGAARPLEQLAARDRTVLVVNTSNMPVAAESVDLYRRHHGGYYRDMGYHVLFWRAFP